MGCTTSALTGTGVSDGIVINGVSYEINRKLGEGGYATVYLVSTSSSSPLPGGRGGGGAADDDDDADDADDDDATDVNRSGRRCYALKRMLLLDDDRVRMARAEVSTMRRVRHHNVLSLVDHAERDSREHADCREALLLLPYIDGGTLDDEIERRRVARTPFDATTLLSLLADACRALAQLHHARPTPLAHRDVKPGNFLLRRRRRDSDRRSSSSSSSSSSVPFELVLMDFGSVVPARSVQPCARATLADEEHTQMTTTPTYRAPELFLSPLSGDAPDERVDVWSLGLTVYALCTLRTPFDDVVAHGGSLALAAQNAAIDADALCRGAPTPALVALVERMLTVDFTERCSIDDVLDECKRLQRQPACPCALGTTKRERGERQN